MIATLYPVAEVGAGWLVLIPRPRGGDWLEDEIEALKTTGITVLVSMLTAGEKDELGLSEESNVVTGAGLEPIDWPVSDYGAPADTPEALRLIDGLLDRVCAGAVLAIHCRQSIGRAPTAAAAILVRHGLSSDDAWARVESARGRPVPDTAEQRRWVEQLVAR